MTKRTKGSDNSDPLVNRRAILKPEEIQKWFSDLKRPITSDDARGIAKMLNDYAFLQAFWKDTQTFKTRRQSNVSLLRLRRIADALLVLQSDLPALIEDSFKVDPKRQDQSIQDLIAFNDKVALYAKGYEEYRSRGRGRQSDGWHLVARKIGTEVLKVLSSNSHGKAGFGKATSPAIKIIQRSFSFLQEERSAEAIVDALRRRRDRTKRSPGK
jgi:hypothetical protein